MAEKPTPNELNRDEMLPEASLSQLQTAFDAINDAVCLLDMNGKILRCNKAMESLLKKSSGEIIGGTCWELIHGMDKPVKDCPIVRMKKTLRRETLVLKVDDKWLNVAVDPVIDETGNLTSAVHIISDITQRKQTEQALHESEEKYRALINRMSDTVWVIDFDANFIDVNDAAVEVLGYSREELLSMGPQDIDTSMDVEEIKGLIEQIPTDGTQVFETTHTAKDGKTIPVEIKSSLVTYQEKQAILSIARDITRRKQTEQALCESEAIYRSVVEHTGAATAIIEEDTTISMANTKFTELSGYSIKEIQGKMKWTDFVAEEDLERMRGYHVKRREREGFAPNSYEFRWIDKQRNIKNILLSIGMIPGTKRSVASLIDITHLKQIEASLQESERRLKKAIEGNPIPTFIIDNNHTITHWNKACEILTGFPASEVVGTKKQWSAFYSEERPVMADFIADGATDEEMAERYKHIVYNKSALIEGAYEGENFYPDLGEKGKWLFFTAAPLIGQQGNIIGAIETFQDITERKSMEKQLRQSQKLEAIGTLAGGIAHDFNNLLTVIIGNAELLLMKTIEDESLCKKIEEIKKAGNRAASLIRQLLAFSRRQIIKPQVLDLNQEINETEKMLKRMIGEDIEFQTVLGHELWKVYADPGQINQVIINIVVNARDAISACADSEAGRPQGGRLTVETANADLDKNYFRDRGIKEASGPYVMLAVSDNGIGMDKKTREQISDPFFTTKEVDKGTGLGLSTVYGIVKQNRGFIWVYSEPGQGSTFRIYLPKINGDTEPEGKKQPFVDKTGGSETVLIVEDDEGLLTLAQNVLQGCGYRMLSAENGEEALKVGKEYEGQIDLMITDVVMPKMGGREAADRLQPLYPQMKVVYMSGYTDNAIVRHGVLEPGLNFLKKPFTPEGLARKVREVLDAEKR